MKYTDIAHGMRSGLLWLYVHDRIETAPTSSGTHASIWGEDLARLCWRGRYEPDTGLLSISAPERFMFSSCQPPSHLLDRLEEKFGGDIDTHAFNPMGELIELRGE